MGVERIKESNYGTYHRIHRLNHVHLHDRLPVCLYPLGGADLGWVWGAASHAPSAGYLLKLLNLNFASLSVTFTFLYSWWRKLWFSHWNRHFVCHGNSFDDLVSDKSHLFLRIWTSHRFFHVSISSKSDFSMLFAGYVALFSQKKVNVTPFRRRQERSHLEPRPRAAAGGVGWPRGPRDEARVDGCPEPFVVSPGGGKPGKIWSGTVDPMNDGRWWWIWLIYD